MSLCLIKHHAMKTCGGVDIAQRILNLGSRWSTSRRGRFAPKERASGSYWIEA
jgi:hypothetical protein